MKKSKIAFADTETQIKIMNYNNQNNLEINYFSIASQEYHGCRCCFRLDVKLPGLLCAEQSIEKLLKSYLYHYKTDGNTIKKLSHRLSDIVNEIEKKQDLQLNSELKQTIKRLEKYWDTKYPAKKDIRTLLKNEYHYLQPKFDELPNIDELFYHLLIRHPIIPELKFLIGIFGLIGLHEKRIVKERYKIKEVELFPKLNFLLNYNVPLLKNLEMIIKKNKLFLSRIYLDHKKVD